MNRKILILLAAFISIAAPCMAGSSIPNGILDVNEIQRLVDGLPIKHPTMWKGTLWTDRYYRATTLDEMAQYTRVASRTANSLPWNGEAGDCDDAAILFKGSLIRQAVQRGGENPIPAGVVSLMHANRSDVHAMIWFVDDAMDLWFIEPRGELISHWTALPGLKVFWMMG